MTGPSRRVRRPPLGFDGCWRTRGRGAGPGCLDRLTKERAAGGTDGGVTVGDNRAQNNAQIARQVEAV